MPTTKTTPTEILRATWQVFHEYGYHDASLQQLATAAGLGKAGLLHHFGSKRGVMQAVIDFAIAWYEEKALTLLSSEGTLEERWYAFMEAHFRLVKMNGRAGCFMANSILETGVKGDFAESLQRFHSIWTAAATASLAERFPPDEAAERAYRIFADYQGSVVLFKLYRDDSHLERLRERTLASLSYRFRTEENGGAKRDGDS